jgi:hypothetical protein
MKKAIKLVTFLVAFSVLALSVSAFTAVGSGDAQVGEKIAVEITAAEGGALAAMVTVSVTGGVVFTGLGDGAALAVENLDNGTVGIISLNVSAGAVATTLIFDAVSNGDYTITLVGSDDFAGVTRTITGTVGEVWSCPICGSPNCDGFCDVCTCGDCAECGYAFVPCDCGDCAECGFAYVFSGCADCGEYDCVCNPPTGVALAIIPALVAGAAVAIARKKN